MAESGDESSKQQKLDPSLLYVASARLLDGVFIAASACVRVSRRRVANTSPSDRGASSIASRAIEERVE